MSRILLVCNQFPKFSESFIARKLVGLLQRGWDAQVACARSDDEQWAHFADLLPRADHADRVHLLGDFDEIVARVAPDLVHFEFGHLARGRVASPTLAGRRVVASLRGNDVNALGLDDPEYHDELWQGVDGLHVLTGRLFGRAVERGCPPALPHVVIPPAVDPTFFAPPERRADTVGTVERPLRILSVGRLHWMKGYPAALQAVAHLRNRGIACEYRIAGAADYGEGGIEVQFAIHDQHLQDVVTLIGACSQVEVREQLGWADVLLHGAISEGFCNAALEAQAMGVPVVGTAAIGENVLDGRTGLLAPLRDPVGMGERLERLAADAGLRLRLGAEGRRRAATEFRLDDQIGRFADWYRSVLATGGEEAETRALRIRLRRQRSELAQLELEHQRLACDVERREGAEALRALVLEHVPEGELVLVVSRGDEALLDLGRPAAHFPQTADGRYLGHHPASSAAAIEQLELLRETGRARFLAFPRTGMWWLEHYRALRDHLETRYDPVVVDDRAGAVFDLGGVEIAAAGRRTLEVVR